MHVFRTFMRITVCTCVLLFCWFPVDYDTSALSGGKMTNCVCEDILKKEQKQNA